MVESFVQYQGSQLHYEIFGAGKQSLLLFHGFGQDRKIFKSTFESLHETYTLYAFDLYFHGDSIWSKGEAPLEKLVWKETVATFFKKENITRFTVAGFSLGARFALATLESFPERTSRIILLAPDGLKVSFWYTLATSTTLFRTLFKGLTNNHKRFIQVVRMIRKAGLITESRARFAESQTSSEISRNRVYASWVVFRKLRFNSRALAQIVNEHGIPLTFVMGEYDQVIKADAIAPLQSNVKKVRTQWVKTGHHALMAQAIPYFLDAWD